MMFKNSKQNEQERKTTQMHDYIKQSPTVRYFFPDNSPKTRLFHFHLYEWCFHATRIDCLVTQYAKVPVLNMKNMQRLHYPKWEGYYGTERA